MLLNKDKISKGNDIERKREWQPSSNASPNRPGRRTIKHNKRRTVFAKTNGKKLIEKFVAKMCKSNLERRVIMFFLSESVTFLCNSMTHFILESFYLLTAKVTHDYRRIYYAIESYYPPPPSPR